jgi:hypothetical protein
VSAKRTARVNPAQKKAAKQKKILIGLAVVLLALGAFELPKLMKHGSSAAGSTTTTVPVGTTAGGSTGGGVTPTTVPPTPVSATTPSAPATLPSEAGAEASSGQLVSFSLFRSKDPFAQQVATPTTDGPPGGGSGGGSGAPPASTAPTTTTSTPPASTTPTTTPVETPPADTTPVGTTPTDTTPTTPTDTTPTDTNPPSTTPPTTTVPPPPAPKPISAKIQVNGVAEDVNIGDSFPKAQPLFRLVAIKDGVPRIGISGGTLQGSTQTVPLVKNKTLTLMNTADGMRYVLRLVSVAYTAGS